MEVSCGQMPESERDRMSTAAEGKILDDTFLRYYYGRKVVDSDRNVLDRLCRAAYIDYYSENGFLYARASKTGRCLKPKLSSRIRLLAGRV